MKKQKKNKIDKCDVLICIYWILSGLGVSAYTIHRDGHIGLSEFLLYMLVGGAIAPVGLIGGLLLLLNQIKIGF